jgi:hypothetical protein
MGVLTTTQSSFEGKKRDINRWQIVGIIYNKLSHFFLNNSVGVLTATQSSFKGKKLHINRWKIVGII